MATIVLSLSTKSNKTTQEHEVMIRFYHGKINQRAKTNVYVKPEYWSTEHHTICIPNWRLLTEEKIAIQKSLQQKQERLNNISLLVQSSFQELGSGKGAITKDWLKSILFKYNSPVEDVTVAKRQTSFFDVFSYYIDESDFSLGRKRHFKVVWRTLKRYELYTGVTLDFASITDDTLRDIEAFIKEEHNICQSAHYAAILNAVPESRTPKPRGKNTINYFMRQLRTFILWTIDRGYSTTNPFKKYKIVDCLYGTPIFITVDERNHLYEYDFSANPRLERQRDIFVFQCLIGCRVSDLWAMTRDCIVDGFVEYIPRKTKGEEPVTVRVPLNSIALEIVERYKDCTGGKLLPFTSQQHYNKDIKTIFREAGLTRNVVVINPTTREEEIRPICDTASSHLARRCFIGNLYKRYKDPNLIGKLSGHKEGSKAFVRYRDIDDDILRELVTSLE